MPIVEWTYELTYAPPTQVFRWTGTKTSMSLSEARRSEEEMARVIAESEALGTPLYLHPNGSTDLGRILKNLRFPVFALVDNVLDLPWAGWDSGNEGDEVTFNYMVDKRVASIVSRVRPLPLNPFERREELALLRTTYSAT